MPSYPFDAGYCDEDDVLQLFANVEAFSKLTPERARSAIADTAVEMDAVLRRFYLTPVSADADALAVLRIVNKELARSFVQMTFDRSSTNKEAGGGGWRERALGILKQVVPDRAQDGTQPYPTIRFLTAPLQSPTELPAFPAGAGATFNQDDDADLHPEKGPFFERADRSRWRDGLI